MTQHPLTVLNATSLAGYWIHILKNEYSKCGQIAMAVGAEHYLVRFRPHDEMPPSSSLLTINDLCDSADYYVTIFDTEVELDAWLKWADEPHDDNRPRVVAIRK